MLANDRKDSEDFFMLRLRDFATESAEYVVCGSTSGWLWSGILELKSWKCNCPSSLKVNISQMGSCKDFPKLQ